MELQILKLPSVLPEASRPSGPQDRDETALTCPRRVRTSWPVAASQSLTVSSTLPVASLRPSGSHATDEIPWECRSGPTTIFLVATSQILARKSSPVETSRVPSRFQASPKIESVCPRSVSTLSAPEVPERVTVPSLCPAARSLSSGLQAPVFTPLGWATSAINRTVSASQILMVPFWPQAATRVPSELNATEQT